MLAKVETRSGAGRQPASWVTPAVLAVGDTAAILGFVALGLQSHHQTAHWLSNLVRISTPFLIGWFATAPLSRAYRAVRVTRPATFLAHSSQAWFTGMVFGLILRSTVFHENFSLSFSIVSLIFTGLFILGWRSVFTFIGTKYLWREGAYRRNDVVHQVRQSS